MQKLKLSQAWWNMPVIPALLRLRQENPEFKDSQGYIVRPCLKKHSNNKNPEAQKTRVYFPQSHS
jgi:hypothetical protein